MDGTRPSLTKRVLIDTPVVLVTQPISEPLSARLTAAGLTVLRGTVDGEGLPLDRIVALMVGLERLERATLTRFPKLELVALSSTGTDSIDLTAAAELGIAVTTVPNQATEEVATHALALTLALIRNLPMHDRNLRAGDWQSPEAIVTPSRTSELTLGILGTGRIGRELARLARPLFADIVGFDQYGVGTADPGGPTMLGSLDELLGRSDILSLHVPRTPETERLLAEIEFGETRVRYLVNVSRGGLIGPGRLLAALRAGSLAGVGLDVFDVEPPTADDHELIGHPRVISTPHRAWESVQSRRAYAEFPVENTIAFIRGEALVSPVQ